MAGRSTPYAASPRRHSTGNPVLAAEPGGQMATLDTHGRQELCPVEAEAVLIELASVFFQQSSRGPALPHEPVPSAESRYRALVEQIPAVVFMAYLDEGSAEAYVSPHIE